MAPEKKSVKKEKRQIEQFCSVCKKTFQMEVVEEVENNEVVWLKCPDCEGFLPYMIEAGGDNAGGGDGSGSEDVAPEDFTADEKENALEYDKTSEYTIGDIIYHRSWNDYGKVVSKETLPGHRNTIIVHFGHQGQIRLLEGEGQEPN